MTSFDLTTPGTMTGWWCSNLLMRWWNCVTNGRQSFNVTAECIDESDRGRRPERAAVTASTAVAERCGCRVRCLRLPRRPCWPDYPSQPPSPPWPRFVRRRSRPAPPRGPVREFRYAARSRRRAWRRPDQLHQSRWCRPGSRNPHRSCRTCALPATLPLCRRHRRRRRRRRVRQTSGATRS